jgi:hypothetical protein
MIVQVLDESGDGSLRFFSRLLQPPLPPAEDRWIDLKSMCLAELKSPQQQTGSVKQHPNSIQTISNLEML